MFFYFAADIGLLISAVAIPSSNVKSFSTLLKPFYISKSESFISGQSIFGFFNEAKPSSFGTVIPLNLS